MGYGESLGSQQATNEDEYRHILADIGRRTYRAGFVAATDGNLSVRLSPNTILISPSGYALGDLQSEDFVVIDLDGNLLSPQGSSGVKQTSEWRMHTAVYQARSDVNAIVHAHPPMTIAFTIAGETLAGCLLPEVVVGLGTIPTTEYATPTTDDTARVVAEMIVRRDALILDRHGTVTVGKTPMEAYHKLEKVEHTAHITHAARQLGRVQELPPKEVQKLLKMREKAGLPPLIPNCNNCGLRCGERV